MATATGEDPQAIVHQQADHQRPRALQTGLQLRHVNPHQTFLRQAAHEAAAAEEDTAVAVVEDIAGAEETGAEVAAVLAEVAVVAEEDVN